MERGDAEPGRRNGYSLLRAEKIEQHYFRVNTLFPRQ